MGSMGDGGAQSRGVNTGRRQARSAADRAYEERLLAGWHERTGFSARMLRQLLQGARVAARGGIEMPDRGPVVRAEIEAWMSALVAVLPLLGGLTVTDEARKPGALGARYDARIEHMWRTAAADPAQAEELHARQQLIIQRFQAALFLAYAPGTSAQARERVLAVAQRLAGPTAGCRGVEVQVSHLTRLADQWLNEQFEVLTADL